jgi:hypothetical protein
MELYCPDCKGSVYGGYSNNTICNHCGKPMKMKIKKIKNMKRGEIGRFHQYSTSTDDIPIAKIWMIEPNDKGRTILRITIMKDLHNVKEEKLVFKTPNWAESGYVCDYDSHTEDADITDFDIVDDYMHGMYVGETLRDYKNIYYKEEKTEIIPASNLQPGEKGYLHVNTGGCWMCGFVPIGQPVRNGGKCALINGAPHAHDYVRPNELDLLRVCRSPGDANNINSIEVEKFSIPSKISKIPSLKTLHNLEVGKTAYVYACGGMEDVGKKITVLSKRSEPTPYNYNKEYYTVETDFIPMWITTPEGKLIGNWEKEFPVINVFPWRGEIELCGMSGYTFVHDKEDLEN